MSSLITVTEIKVKDVRFPTSLEDYGPSDAVVSVFLVIIIIILSDVSLYSKWQHILQDRRIVET